MVGLLCERRRRFRSPFVRQRRRRGLGCNSLQWRCCTARCRRLLAGCSSARWGLVGRGKSQLLSTALRGSRRSRRRGIVSSSLAVGWNYSLNLVGVEEPCPSTREQDVVVVAAAAVVQCGKRRGRRRSRADWWSSWCSSTGILTTHDRSPCLYSLGGRRADRRTGLSSRNYSHSN